MSFFYHDIDVSIKWQELLVDLSNTRYYNPYCFESNYYEIFKKLIISILLDEEVILLDGDYTETELTRICGLTHFEQFDREIDESININFTSKEHLLSKLSDLSRNWRVSIYTSGTTGLPKKVSHTFESITRFVKKAPHYTTDVWGFAYNPTHMAGLQVYFQALLNGNTIVRLFGLGNRDALSMILQNNVSKISATPTYYRLLISDNQQFTSVKQITSGGEKLDPDLIDLLRKTFPNAKIKNVYASTEAGSLFVSEDNIFNIRKEFSHLVKVVENELLLHHSLLGTSESFEGDWYSTGDLVEVIGTDPLKFKFISRSNDLINVGGYQVNLIEVEDAMLSHPFIKMAVVYTKKNSLIGNVICCDVVSGSDDLDEPLLRSYLQTKLQEFKIPRIIRFVDNLQKTNTGKVKRTL
jgi:acyl-coenzyme A synthetase/AMP-(fatty) acid ligase